MLLEALKPERVWYYFEKISAIPRESGNESAIARYIASTVEKMGLEYFLDSHNNVIVYKDASFGRDNYKPVILQGHIDMVCVKTSDSQHNFLEDGIKLLLEGNYLTADRTTLGADNGIAVAMMLAILEDKNINHPNLCCLFTAEEETTMGGALSVDYQRLRGELLINLDSEDDGVLLVGNAGGVGFDLTMPLRWQKNNYSNSYKISISGLKGGHSGGEIHLNRANAIKLLGRMMADLAGQGVIFAIAGGEKMNAIANQASCHFASNLEVEVLLDLLTKIENKFLYEYQISDNKLSISFEKMQNADYVLSEESNKAIYQTLCLLPQGVHTMAQNDDKLVESSNNIGIVEMDDNFVVRSAIRSSVLSKQLELEQQIQFIADLVGATTERYDDYPAWPMRANSPLRELFVQTYQDMFQEPMKVEAVHAGLECGVFAQKMPALDMVSMGPEILEPHTPRERISIASTEKNYHLLLEVLERVE